MRAALIQLDVELAGPPEQRVRRACDLVVAQNACDLVSLPELWPTGYFAFERYGELAEPIGGPTCQALADAARAAQLHLHGGSIVERAEDGRLYNTSVLFSPDGELVHTHRKFHVFGYGSREAELLEAGNELAAYETPFGRVAMTTCYDLRFPELFRVLVEDGAEILLVTAAWPAVRLAHWQLLTRARAVENQCYVLACNAAGSQGGVRLAGNSVVVDPWGTVIAEAGREAEIVCAEIDPPAVRAVRAEFPVLADRRLFVTPSSRVEELSA